MSNGDAKKMLNLYIHDYLCKNNMKFSASCFVMEAGVSPQQDAAISEGEGFLAEWWSSFWDKHSPKPNMDIGEVRQLFSQANQQSGTGTMPGNGVELPHDSLNPMQNASPTMNITGLPNLSADVGSSSMAKTDLGNFMEKYQTLLSNRPLSVGPSFVAKPDIGNFLHPSSLPKSSAAVGPSSMAKPHTENLLEYPPSLPNLSADVGPSSVAKPDTGNVLQTSLANLSPAAGPSLMTGPNVGNFSQSPQTATTPRLGRFAIWPERAALDLIKLQTQNLKNLQEAKMRENKHFGFPIRELNVNSQHLGSKQSALEMPSSSNPRYPQRNFVASNQLSVTQDVNSGTNTKRSILVAEEPTARGTSVSQINTIPEETGLNSHVKRCRLSNLEAPPSNELNLSAPPSNELNLAAPPTNELKLSSSGSVNDKAGPILADDRSKGKEPASGNDETRSRLFDDEVESFLSTPFFDAEMEAFLASPFFNDMTPSQQFDSTPENVDTQGFPFKQAVAVRPTNNLLLSCHFSTAGHFLAAAGHEKKVHIFDLKRRRWVDGGTHSESITDVRFVPNSDTLATASFDKSIRLWDAKNPMFPFMCLQGHSKQVMSLDFNPGKPRILCSCDSDGEIRLWDTVRTKYLHSFKGANRHVRFQPRSGELVAAVTGNVINLISVESGLIHNRFEGHSEEINSICWDDEGKMLVSASDDSVRLWSIGSGQNCVQELHSAGKKFVSCTFDPVRTQMVVLGSYQAIDLWDPKMGSKTWSHKAHEGLVTDLSSSSQLKAIASVSHDQYVKLWNDTGAF